MPHFGRIVTSTEEKITKEGAKKSRQVNKGDLILSNSMSYGLPYIMGIDGYIHDGWFVLKNFENTFDKDYLCNLLISSAIQNQYKRLAAGGVVQNISSDLVNSVSVSIPTMMEQKKISSLLNLIDERIATQNKIIDKLKSLIKGLPHKMAEIGLQKGCWEKVLLSTVLVERKELNSELYTVHSVSVSEGVINQIEYLGRSFAAKDTSNYHVARYGDIIYTKSPTGDFPYGIVKQSYIEQPVAISPLYGVYSPTSFETGVYLHYYFMSSVLAKNYLYPLIQKGAKNTINISNQRFLENRIALPLKQTDRHNIARALITIQKKLDIEKCAMDSLTKQRSYLLQQLFI